VLLAALLGFFILAAIGVTLWLRTPVGRAAANVAQYRTRVLWMRWFGDDTPSGAGALSGVVHDAAGEPLSGALVLVSTVQGVAYSTHSDELGAYLLDGVPPGRYVPVAGKWGYADTAYHKGSDDRTAVSVRARQLRSGIDFALPEYQPWQPSLDEPALLGPEETGYALFPAEISARRVPVTFTNEGLVITTTFVYEPLKETPGKRPVIVAAYPSEPIEWDRVSVALAHEGYVVLANGPSPLRMVTVDVDGMARDLVQAVAYLHDGQLAANLDLEQSAWLGGSFSSLILYRAMWDWYGAGEAKPDIDALIWVGSVSDAFEMVQSLYDVDLAIPERYQDAIAAMGRPDRDPAFFLGFSPAYQAAHMPPSLVAHTFSDEVVPYPQSERFAQALQDAGVEYDLYLYQDTSHYLDQVNITPETEELYRRLAAFLASHLTD
jgi:dienelactone hydrolase